MNSFFRQLFKPNTAKIILCTILIFDLLIGSIGWLLAFGKDGSGKYITAFLIEIFKFTKLQEITLYIKLPIYILMTSLELAGIPRPVLIAFLILANYTIACFCVEIVKVLYSSCGKFKKNKNSQLNKKEIKLFVNKHKTFFITPIIIIGIFIFGFILPTIIIPPKKLGEKFTSEMRRIVEPFGFVLRTAKIIHDPSNQYQNRCSDKEERILVQSYIWMMFSGPVIEACFNLENNTSHDKTFYNFGLYELGIIKKGVYYDWVAYQKKTRIQYPLTIEEIMDLTKLRFGPTATIIKRAIEEAISNGTVPNEHDAAKEYLFKIKDEYLKYAQEWEKA